MMYRIKLMSGDQYFITEEEFKNLSTIKEKGLVFVPSVGGLINLASAETIIREDKIDMSNIDEIICKDGTVAIRKFGQWANKLNGAKIDITRYPELAKDEIPKQITL